MRESMQGRGWPVSRVGWILLVCVGAWSCGVGPQEVARAEKDALNTVLGLVRDAELDGALVAEAVTVLGGLDSADAQPAFLALLDHPDQIVVLRAAEALGRLKGPGAVDALTGLFEKTESAFVKVEVAAALERLNPDTMGPWLAETLGNGQMSMVRSKAAAALGQLGNSSTVPALRRAFGEDSDPVVRSSAALALSRLGDLQSLSAVADTLRETKQLSTSLVMLEVLESYGTTEAIGHLETVAKQKGWQQSLRIRCFEALGGLSATEIGAYLKKQLLEEDDAMDRVLAAEGLGWVQDSTAVDLLRSAFYSPENQPLRLIAAWSLAKLGHGLELSEELEPDLKSAHRPFRKRAAEILGIIGDARRIPALKNALSRDEDISVRRAVVQALGKTNDAEAANTLLWAFHQEASLDIREAIVESLGNISHVQASRALNEILEQSEEAILQAAALRGLATSRDLNQLATLRPYLTDAEPGLRLEAARAIFVLARTEIETG